MKLNKEKVERERREKEEKARADMQAKALLIKKIKEKTEAKKRMIEEA